MRNFLLALSLLGTLAFGGGFALSFVNPLLVERAGEQLLRIEIERRVGARIDGLAGSWLTGVGQSLLRRTDADIERTRQAIRDDVPRKVAEVVANMLDADCECRRRLVELARRSEDGRLGSLVQVRERLGGLVESAYASVARDLMREFRIFTASNALAFALLGLVTLVRRGAALQLALPAVVLVGAVAITGGLYLFQQDWLHTIVFGEYVGLAYAGYLAGVALLLADVVFNRARATTRMANLVLEAVGSAVIAVPC
jgi:hypothetical protein